MSLDRVSAGRKVPDDLNVIIEIPMHAEPIKYEVDKETGAVFVDRFMSTAMHYPCNYGYIPQSTLAQIAHFFQHYKDLEAGKWVKLSGWAGVREARAEVLAGVKRYTAQA